MAEPVLKYYTGKYGQSIHDICLMTYGTLKHLYKLISDNGVSNINEGSFQGRKFIFDSSLSVDIPLLDHNEVDEIIYVTSSGFPIVSVEFQEDGSFSMQEDGTISAREDN